MATVSGAGSVSASFTDGASANAAQQATALIRSAVTGVQTATGSGSYTAGGANELDISTTSNASVNEANFRFLVVGDVFAPLTVTENAPVANQVILLGAGPITLNTDGGSGVIVGGDAASGNTAGKTIHIGAGANWAITTGSGNDTIDLTQSVATGRSTVAAGGGSNTIKLGAEATAVQSSGSDTINAGSGAALVQVVGGGTAPVSVSGGAGARAVVLGAGASTISGGTGTVTVLGGSAGGNLSGGSGGNNVLVASAGTTFLTGGGNGDQLIAMGAGQTVLVAGLGNETLLGGLSTGNNTFQASSGADLIIAGTGNDRIYAGAGSSTVSGGGGANVFIFNAAIGPGGHVAITDFKPGTDTVSLIGTAVTQASGPNVTLSDGSTITFLGITEVGSNFFS